MAKPFSDSLKPRRMGSGAGDLGASVTQGANLETLRYQNEAALPNQYENDAQFFTNLGKNLSAPGDRPRGIGRNLVAGLSEGLAHGSRASAIADRKEKFDKYEKEINYFQDVQRAALEQKQWYETRANAKREMMPQVLAYMDNIDGLDPQSQRIMAADILNQYGQAIGEDFKLSSIDGSNPFLMTIQSDKGQQLFDLRSMFAGDDAIQQSIAMKMPEYQKKLQEERERKKTEFALKQDALDVKKFKEGIPGGAYGVKGNQSNYDPNQKLEVDGISYDVDSLSHLSKKALAHYETKVLDDLDKIPKQNQAYQAIQDMKEVFDRNPNIGSSFVNMLDDPDGVDSWFNIIGRKLAGQDLTDMEILKKATNDLNLDTILGISGKAATDLLKRAVQSASPSGKLTKGGFAKNATTWEKKIKDNIRLANAKNAALKRGLRLSENSVSYDKSNQKDNSVDDSPLAAFGRRVG